MLTFSTCSKRDIDTFLSTKNSSCLFSRRCPSAPISNHEQQKRRDNQCLSHKNQTEVFLNATASRSSEERLRTHHSRGFLASWRCQKTSESSSPLGRSPNADLGSRRQLHQRWGRPRRSFIQLWLSTRRPTNNTTS
ncbi:hypothetical protein MRX96_042904 [Rhipicephalus microplus]